MSDITPKDSAILFAQWLGLNGYTLYADIYWHKAGIYLSIKKIEDLYSDFRKKCSKAINKEDT